MKQTHYNKTRGRMLPLTLGLGAALLAPNALAQTAFTWDGGGGDGLWSTATNWVGDVVPAATGSTLVFDGAVGVANSNDAGTVTGLFSGTAFTFAATAGSFTLGGDPISFDTDANGLIIDNLSGVDQTLNMNLSSAGSGQRDRSINTGGATITLNGDFGLGNDWLFATGTAGTIELTGNNTGPGKGNVVTAGTNALRGVYRSNLAGNHLVLGSPTCLGDFDVDLANLRGFQINSNVSTWATSAGLDLVGANKVDKTIAYHQSCAYTGDNDLELGGVLNTAGNGRGFSVTGDGDLIISGVGFLMTQRQNAQTVVIQPQGNASLILNAPIIDCWHSDGLTSQLTGLLGTPVDGSLRMNGTGTLEINADNSATFDSDFRLFQGTTILGHVNALGSNGTTPVSVPAVVDAFTADPLLLITDTTGLFVGMTVTGAGIPVGAVITAIDPNVSVTVDLAPTVTDPALAVTFDGEIANGVTEIRSGATLDLNGLSIDETILVNGTGVGGFGAIINSDTGTAGEITTVIDDVGSFTVGGAGDVILPSVTEPAGVSRRITKTGAGTLTLGGDVSNNRHGLTVDEGDVNLAKTAGDAVGRFALIMNNAASTVTLQGNDQIHTNQDVNGTMQINEGTLDLNGFNESFARLEPTSGSGGVVTNSNGGTTSTLTLLGGIIDATSPGAITGNLNLVKQGTNIQTLSGTISYTGDTSVEGGTLSIAAATLDDGSAISIASGALLDLTHAVTDTVDTLTIGGVGQAAGVYGALGSGAAIEVAEITGTGFLNVLNGPSATDYDTWMTDESVVGGPDDDDDNDGRTNFDEYAFGLLPLSSSSSTPFTGAVDTATGTFIYTRRNVVLSGLTYSYLESDDIVSGFDPFTPDSEMTDSGSPIETVTVTVPAALLGANPTLLIQISAE